MGVQVKHSVNFIRWFSRFQWLIFSLVLLCIVVIGGWFATNYLGDRAKQEIIKDNESAISVLSVHLTGELKKLEGVVMALSGSPGIAPALVSRMEQDMMNANAALDRYNTAIGASVSYLIDSAGVTIASSNRNDADSFVGKSYRFRPYFIQAMQGRPGRYFGLGVTSFKRGFYSSYPVRDSNGYIMGAVAMKKDLDEAERQLSSYPSCFFVDQHGIILLSSNKDMIFKSLWPVNQKTQGILIASKQFGEKPFEAIMSQEVVDGMNVALNGNHYLASRKVVDPEGWSLVLMTPTHRVMIYKSIGFVMTVLIGILIMMPAVVSYKAARSAEIVRESEERFRQVAQSSRDWIWETDGDGYYTYSSQIVKDILDYSPEEILGKHISDFFVSEERGRFVPLFKGLFDKKDSFYRIVHRHTRRDGQEVFLESTGFPMVDHESNLVGYRGIHRDITARRVAEEALRRSEEKYRELVENANSIILRRDHAGNVTFLNEYAQNFFGYTEEEIVGRNIVGTIVPEVESTGRNLRQMVEDIGLNPDRYVNNINENIRRNGERVWIAWTNKPVRDENGRVASVLCIGNDITERKRAEEALRESRQQLADIINFLPDATFVIDNDKKIVTWNRAMEEMTGVKKEDVIGQGDYVYTIPFYGERQPYLLDLIDSSDEELKSRYQYVRRKGNTLFAETFTPALYGGKGAYVRATGAPLFDVLGNRVGAIESIRDITDRKRAEEALKRSEKLYRSVIENIRDTFYRADIEGKLVMMSPSGAKLFGYDAVEGMIGLDIAETFYVNPEDRKKLLSAIKIQGHVTDYEIKLRRRDGSHIEAATSSHQYVDENGNPLGIEGVLRDITERKQAEALYRTLADSSHAGVYIVQDGKIQFVNPHIMEYSGYEEKELTGSETISFVHPDDRETVRANAVDMLKGRRSTPYEFRIIDRRGNVKWVMETVRSIVYEGKRAVLGNTMDITERYQMERLLRQSQKMEAIGTLAGGIAHDFNNMLGAMVGYTEMAQLQAHTEKQRYYLDQVLCACDRAKDLVNQILAFSRQREHEMKPVLLASIVKEGIKLLRSSLPTTVQIEQGISDSSVAVLADPTQIHQVLVNLCTNAAHAMREKGGILSIGLDREDVDSSGRRHPFGLEGGEYARLTVVDTGCGMDGFIVEKIFDPFFTTKGPGEGTGLGLSVVYGIVKNYGGVIDVSSEPGKGTTFRVYLPLIETNERVEEKVSAAVPGGDERIMFVDDDPALVEVGRMMLTSLGYQVTSRTSSVDALEAFRVRPFDFDLVITDMTMPNMTGIDLAREVLKIRPDIPIILCTGFSEIISEEKAKGVGIRRFVMKPIFKMELAEVIREVLNP
ncbi:MAG: PAS domain S-box protein [Deltaproteobacteria bacterium]|nr:PAS domain S-box protein [Deltaproteobacteria bacterium]